VQGDRDKGRDSVLVARVGMILEAVCKDPPCIQADITEIFVLAASDSSAHLSQVDGVLHDLRVSVHELRMQEGHGPAEFGQKRNPTKLFHEGF